MKKSLLISFVFCCFILACTGRGPHIQWAPSLDKGLVEAKASNRNVVIDFTSPT